MSHGEAIMKILLFGMSCVGKTTTGKLLSEKLGWSFYDLDDEVKRRKGTTIENFVKSAPLRERDKVRGEIIREILNEDENLVLAVSPISYPESFSDALGADGIILIELWDTPYHIFQRLVFSDEDDNIYSDEKYKNAHKTHYMREIREDLDYYGKIYSSLGAVRFNINNDSPEKVVERIITGYSIQSQ